MSASLALRPQLGVGARRLDDEDVGAADRLVVAAVDLAVGERLQRDRAEVDAELVGDPRRQLGVGAPREEHQPLVVVDREARGHGRLHLDAHDDAQSTRGSRRRVRRLALLLALGVALDVGLALAGDPEGAGRHVLGDRRVGAGVGAVADVDRRDEGRVDRRADVRADRRAVLAAAVVVGGDGRGAEVRVRPDVGVADVAEVRDLRALADVGVLDLDEGAGLGALAQQRAGAQVGERARRSPPRGPRTRRGRSAARGPRRRGSCR